MPVVNHNARVLRELRAAGYTAEVVERWDSFGHVRKDLFGVIDVLAVGNGHTLAVQVTSRGNMASRRRKVRECEAFSRMLGAGWIIQVWGYDKPGHRWRVKVDELNPF